MNHITVLPNDLLVSFDWANLYPSINHNLLLSLLQRFLTTRLPVPLTTFICRAVHLVLTKNFCQFGNKFYRQFLGFATGVSSGASLAHIFLYELTRTTFTQNMPSIPFLKCYIDDGLLIWRGPRPALELMLNNISTLAQGMRITYEIHDDHVTFLDLTFYKGPNWSETNHLDVKLYTKPANAFLYKTFDSAAPRSQYIGVILGGITRLIIRNSELKHFRTDLSDLYRRLKARGYAASFLNTHFNKSHNWSERPQLLNKVTTPKPTSDTERVFTLAVPYSRALETTNIARAIHAHETMLPSHLTDGEHIVAWKAASRLGSTVTTYRYTGDVP
jgi:hypothetical protein